MLVACLPYFVSECFACANQHSTCILRATVAIFFFYPTICNALFSTFNCRHIAEDQSLLVDDDRIFCESTAHRTYWQISMLLIVLFAVGVPVSVFNFLLRRRREYDRNQQDNKELIEKVVSRLDQQASADSRAPAALSKYTSSSTMTVTKANILLREVRDGQDVAFLLSSYKPSRHYWECLGASVRQAYACATKPLLYLANLYVLSMLTIARTCVHASF